MRKTNREVECLKRMQSHTPMFEELIAFLLQEYLLSQEELKALKVSPEQAKLLQAKLATLSDERVLQLLEYEWTLLPTERIRINIVTDRGFKEFIAEV
jgi:hypothetical protein